MPKMSIRIPEDQKKRMKKHKEVNWSEIARKAFKEHLNKLEIAETISTKSNLSEKDAKDIGEKIKKEIAKKHGLID